MKELNDLDSNRKLEDIRRCSNKELIVTRDMLEGFKSLKEYAKLGKQRSFQYVSGVSGTAYNPFDNEEAMEL